MKIKRWFLKALPTLVLILVWASFMWYATVAGARQLYRNWKEKSRSFESSAFSETGRLVHGKEAERFLVAMEYLELPLYGGTFDSFDGYSDLEDHVEIAWYYLDAQGKATPAEGHYAVIGYERPNENVRYSCYMDMDTAPEEWKEWLTETLEAEYPAYEAPTVALYGTLEGERFVPLKAQWTNDCSPEEWALTTNVNWTLIFDHTNGTVPPVTLWTLACSDGPHPHGSLGIHLIDTTTGPISFGNSDFENFQALAEYCVETQDETDWYVYRDGYYELLYPDTTSLAELWETVFVKRTYNPEDSLNSSYEDVNLASCVQILRCYPLRSAMLQMLPIYVHSLALVLLIFFLMSWLRRRRYAKSLHNTLRRGEGYETDISTVPHGWTALSQLESRYIEAADTLRRQTPELTRLETALSYAGDAEENRRKLVSDMTHELKTPLAVIHSYAEGLSEGIAPEKREQYLGIIMEEAEKMDAMVLSMLDLSRLEAGKVRLSRAPVCLMDMTKATFEKLEPLYKEKNLTLHYFGQTFDSLADEGRMEQVITNLVTNAIKYCRPEGHISVTVKRQGTGTYYAIENDCDNLSEKALSQLFDSFFREDAARTTKGTGLGLPIVKAIVELHGGTCIAVNTHSGVEFRITLP